MLCENADREFRGSYFPFFHDFFVKLKSFHKPGMCVWGWGLRVGGGVVEGMIRLVSECREG